MQKNQTVCSSFIDRMFLNSINGYIVDNGHVQMFVFPFVCLLVGCYCFFYLCFVVVFGFLFFFLSLILLACLFVFVFVLFCLFVDVVVVVVGFFLSFFLSLHNILKCYCANIYLVFFAWSTYKIPYAQLHHYIYFASLCMKKAKRNENLNYTCVR